METNIYFYTNSYKVKKDPLRLILFVSYITEELALLKLKVAFGFGGKE